MNTNKEEEKVLVWLPKSVATKIEQLENPNNCIQEYINESKREIKLGFDSFDEEIFCYRAGMAKMRKEMQEAYREATESHYKAWEDFDKNRKSLHSMAEKAKGELAPLVEEVEKLNGLLVKIQTWDIQRFLEMIEKIKGHLYGEDRNIIEFLINNYKKK